MSNNGWRELDACPETGRILVWHVYQGVMVVDAEAAKKNRFHAYWQKVPESWIRTADRLPDKADADAYDCVIVKDKWDDIRMIGWHQVPAMACEIVSWQSMPVPPNDYMELLRSSD